MSSPPQAAAPETPTAVPEESSNASAAVSSATTSNNPGSYEELHRKCREVFPMCFEGAKIMVQKGLSQHFQVTHTLSISPALTGYRFGATYVGDTAPGGTEPFPVMLGDADASGNATATLIHQFGERWRLKLLGNVQGGKLSGAQGSLDYRGRLSTTGVTLANVDLIAESGVVVGQYLRRLTPKLDVGAELMYHYGKQIPGSQISVLNYAARYTSDNFTISGTVGTHNLHLCYYHKQVENLAFGVEFESNRRLQETLATFAYQADLPEEGVTMRASVDTNWTVAGVFEKKLNQSLPFTLAISGMINHVKAQGKFGIGLIIG